MKFQKKKNTHNTPSHTLRYLHVHFVAHMWKISWKGLEKGSLRCYLNDYLYLYWLTLLIISISVDSFQRYWWCWWSKNPAIWLDEKHNCLHPTKSGSLICSLLDGCLHAKKLKYQLIFKGILLIQTSCNLIRPKVNLDTSNQSGILWCYLTFLIIPMHRI